jgi:hypothetical protein
MLRTQLDLYASTEKTTEYQRTVNAVQVLVLNIMNCECQEKN